MYWERDNRDELSLFILIILTCQRRKSALNTLLIPYSSKVWVYLKRWGFLRMIAIGYKGFNRALDLLQACHELNCMRNHVWNEKINSFLVLRLNTNVSCVYTSPLFLLFSELQSVTDGWAVNFR